MTALIPIPVPALEVLPEHSSCSIGDFARGVRNGFWAEKMDWAIAQAEGVIRNPATDTETRLLLQALILRDMLQQIDRENAMRVSGAIYDAIGKNESRRATQGHVYFIRAESSPGVMKIGYSTSPKHRLKQLQTASREQLVLVAVFLGTQQDEGKIHRVLRNQRVSGEWFRLSDEAALRICEAASAGKSVKAAAKRERERATA